MLGTFGGALDARHIDASNGKLVADVTGEVETDEGVLVIRRIHVAMQLVAPEQARDTVERVHGIYAMRCPLYRTLHNSIQLTSSVTLSDKLEHFHKSYSVLGAKKIALAIGGGNGLEGRFGGQEQGAFRARSLAAQHLLDLAPHVFDGVEVGGIGR